MPVNWMLDGQAHVYSVYKHTSFQVQGKKQNEIPDRDTRKQKKPKYRFYSWPVCDCTFVPAIDSGLFFPGSKPTCDFLTPLHYTAEKKCDIKNVSCFAHFGKSLISPFGANNGT